MITALRTTVELSEELAVEADSAPINRRLRCAASSVDLHNEVALEK